MKKMYAQHADYRRCGSRAGEVAGKSRATNAGRIFPRWRFAIEAAALGLPKN
jgi:hypothetical protein